MALDATTLAKALVQVFTHRKFRRAFAFWKEILEEIIAYLQAELELVNFAKAWDNFDKDALNEVTFTVQTTRTSAQSSYAINSTSDEVVFQDTGAGAGGGFTITLPAAPFSGQHITVKDTSGNASTRNITISGNGNNIDGVGSVSIITNYGARRLTYAGSDWFIV